MEQGAGRRRGAQASARSVVTREHSRLGAGSGQRSLVESSEHVVWEKLGARSEQKIGSRGKLAKCNHKGALKRSRRRF